MGAYCFEGFEDAFALKPGLWVALAGIAVSAFKLGQVDNARAHRAMLTAADSRYYDAKFAQNLLNWVDAETIRQIINL